MVPLSHSQLSTSQMLHWSGFNGGDIIHSSYLGGLGPERFNSVDRIIQEATGYHPELSGIALSHVTERGGPRAQLSYDQDTTSSVGRTRWKDQTA